MLPEKVKTYKNLINGEWIETGQGEYSEDINPANFKEVVGLFPRAGVDDAKHALEAARAALPAWSNLPAPARGAILDKASQIINARMDEMSAVLTREEGKTLAEARSEVMRARDIFRFHSGEGWRYGGQVLPSSVNGELLYTKREALGVVTIISPWNFPIAIPSWKIAPALAYGNTVVFKPAEFAPMIGCLLVEALVDAGVPAGVINFITGKGSVIGDELVGSPLVNGVSFTGSVQVGTHIYQQAIRNLTRVQLEMGGKNALVVLKDANLDLAVDLAVRGGFGLTGQACTATSRVIVEAPVVKAFSAALAAKARSMVVGDGMLASTQMGPLVNREQVATIQEYISIGEQEGARLLAGGSVDESTGYFATPTVFDQVEPGMRIAQEEIFGPVLGVICAENLEDAIEKSNRVNFGLTAGVMTNDLNKAFAFANQAEAGVVKINEPTTGLALNAPFGGFKNSSANTFKEQGLAAIEFYTRTKTIYVGHG